MFRNAVICVLLGVVIMLAAALVRVENERYALWLGMCPNIRDTFAAMAEGHLDSVECRKTIVTRAGWWWHIYYAIADKG